MRKKFLLLFMSVILISGITSVSSSSVEWLEQGTLEVGEIPLDVVTSADGMWTFVLTTGGNISIYSVDGVLEEKITTGEPVDGIEVSPRGDRIFLYSRERKAVKIISLEFIKNIDVSGSPLKGPDDAPVVVAVYSDFQ